MKKEDLTSTIVMTLMFVMSFLIAFFVVKPVMHAQDFSVNMNEFLFVIITIVVGIIVNVLFLEIGHVIGGLLGNYSIVSFNVLWFCLYKKDKKWKFGFRNFDGFTGETIITPKSEKSSPRAYIWIPLLFYIIELTVGITLYSIYNGTQYAWLAVASIIFVTIGSVIALYNFVPFKLDSMTDGYRLTLVSKKGNIEAFNELLRIKNLEREGKEIKDVKIFDDITDFTAQINLITVYDLLSQRKLYEASQLIEKMLEDPKKISTVTYRRLVCQKLYIMLIKDDLATVRNYYDEFVPDDVRRFISNDLSMESLRAYILIAGLLDESNGEVEYANARKTKAMKRTDNARLNIEKELYQEALNKVKRVHPDWKIENDEEKEEVKEEKPQK